ncbi:hypothetical protein JTE90_022176 [Oedothorax gibbosus]|uniref:BRCT domain-containing protein n=1 Tax=Oedothorax gibbosus TaxID=931172 RepID=A0AAV6VRQ8_9ARAC|nr:hypothetical protein JTE90_022176 [Oedothorax gibbosus]
MSMSKEPHKYEVCFVKNEASNSESSENLQRAFEAMDSNQMEPIWITEEDCLQVSKKESKLYIMDPFEGQAFQHLKSVNCRIVGPLCILYCLEKEEILPKRPHPVYSVSMRRITVSCSNIDNGCRENVRSKVELMGGLFSKDFTKSVSHLVVGEVGSKKYQVAANYKLPIMTPSWIEDVWKNGQYKLIHATDSSFDKHKCPVFKGLVITVSQLSTSERADVQATIEENGGSYLAPLKARETTHLVLSDPSGDKYRYAKNWKIFCVNLNWVFDSVEAGYCKDENLYKIENTCKPEQPKRSTPNRDLTSCDLPMVDCSAITNASFVTHLDETIKSDISFPVVKKKNGQFPVLDEFDLSTLPNFGQFLDGCKIFLTGFNGTQMLKLRKIVNSTGGMRFSIYSESITHVVVGDLTKDFLQTLKSSSVTPYVVKVDWLLECCRKEDMVDEGPFLCMNPTLHSPEKEEPEHKPVSTSQIPKPLSRNEDNTPDHITDIFNQYICGQNAETSKKSENNSTKETKNSSIESVPQPRLPPDQHIEVVDLEEECTTGTQLLFAGLKFIIVGFGDKDTDILAKMIETHSGIVFGNEGSSTADIAVVPIIKHDYTICASNVVTNCWLQKCIEDSRMFEFDENELFKPIEIPIGAKPFESFVISVSQYSGTERDCLMHLAEVLGATCQEYFVRKANKSRGILSNTHLVVATPEGSKYEAAKKWKIPAVTKHWVLDAANLGVAPSLEKYLVDACVPVQMQEDNPINPDFQVLSKGKENVSQDIAEEVFAVPEKVSVRRSSVKITVANGFDEVKNVDLIKDMPKKIIETDLSTDLKLVPVNISSTPKHLNKLCSDNKNVDNFISPLISKPDLSVNESLSFNQSYKNNFHVSGLLKDLDSSVSQDHSLSASMKRQSLPIEDLFGKNLASCLRKVNKKVFTDDDSKIELSRNSFHEAAYPEPIVDNAVLKGVVVCISKKLVKMQTEIIEIVAALGGDYVWTYDSSCTHYVFAGKANDLTKEFREARSQGKKIVCPQWVYACKETQTLVDEELYPHTLKQNMSLTGEIAIVKTPVVTSESKPDIALIDVDEDSKSNDAAPTENNGVDFNQQLNDLLVAAKSAKKRQSKRLLHSVSSSPVNEISPIHRLHKQNSNSFIKPANKEENEDVDTQETYSQQSQSCPVVWDDPTGRMEREKIALLAAAQMNARNIPSTSTNKNDSTSKAQPKKSNSSTFNCDGLMDEFCTELPTHLEAPKMKKFMFTNIPDPKKLKYIEIIKQLGGEISDEKAFDLTATHLISEKPIKNEKLLSSVASGKWIIHPQYLIVSQQQNKFVPEEEFEWGGSSTGEFLNNLPNSSKKLATCPFRWRVKLNGTAGIKGAFHGWKVTVIADDKAKQATYVKILEAGGAEVFSSESSSSVLDKLSHAIVDMKKRTLSQLDLGPYVSNNIRCIKPEYLAFFLIEDPSPDVENFLIPEAKELMGASEQSSAKRRNLSVATRANKRTKLT